MIGTWLSALAWSIRRLGHADSVLEHHRRTSGGPHLRRDFRYQSHGSALVRRSGLTRPDSENIHEQRGHDEGGAGSLWPDLQRARGILDDVLVYRWPDGFGMVVNASNREKIVAWIASQQVVEKVPVQNATQEVIGHFSAASPKSVRVNDVTVQTFMVAVQGPQAVDMCQGMVPEPVHQLSYYYGCWTTYKGKRCSVSRTGYTGEDGLEFIVSAEQAQVLWEDLLSRGAIPCGLGARDSCAWKPGCRSMAMS